MDEPPWKRMVDELRQQRFESPYLERLRAHLGTGGRDDLAGEVLREMAASRTTERQGRVIDHDASGSMEKKKKEGYF